MRTSTHEWNRTGIDSQSVTKRVTSQLAFLTQNKNPCQRPVVYTQEHQGRGAEAGALSVVKNRHKEEVHIHTWTKTSESFPGWSLKWDCLL